jgi:hypothetical protein
VAVGHERGADLHSVVVDRQCGGEVAAVAVEVDGCHRADDGDEAVPLPPGAQAGQDRKRRHVATACGDEESGCGQRRLGEGGRLLPGDVDDLQRAVPPALGVRRERAHRAGVEPVGRPGLARLGGALHRRREALGGLVELPCVIVQASEGEQPPQLLGDVAVGPAVSTRLSSCWRVCSRSPVSWASLARVVVASATTCASPSRSPRSRASAAEREACS